MSELALRTIFGKSAEPLLWLHGWHRLPRLFLMRKVLPIPSILEILLNFFDSCYGISDTAFLNVPTRLAFWETVALIVFPFVVGIVLAPFIWLLGGVRLLLMRWRLLLPWRFPIGGLLALFSRGLFIVVLSHWWQLYSFRLDFLLLHSRV